MGGALGAALALGIVALSGATAAAAPSTDGAPDPTSGPASDPTSGWSCDDETLRWGGAQVLDAAIPSFDTGVDVVASPGTRLTVVGVSADGLDATDHARALPVMVGDVQARPGAALPGGDVVVVTDGSDVLRVHGVTVVVRRCLEVASGPDLIAPAADGSATPVTAGSGAAAMPASPATRAQDSSPSPVLPVTGGESWAQTLIGAGLIALGGALVTFGRSRDTDVA